MKSAGAWLFCLLLLGLALQGAASRAHQHSMEIRSECPAPLPPPGVTGGGAGLATSRAGASLLSVPELGAWPPVSQTPPPAGPDTCSQGSRPSTRGRVTLHHRGDLGLSAPRPRKRC